jgi:hypothetical protein
VCDIRRENRPIAVQTFGHEHAADFPVNLDAPMENGRPCPFMRLMNGAGTPFSFRSRGL